MRAYQTLRKRSDFKRLSDSRSASFSHHIVLQYQPAAAEDSPLRVGFTVSRKIGNAVKRNRVKRQLRAIVQQVAKEGSLAGDYVLVARTGAYEASYQRLQGDFTYCLKKMRDRV